jgi:GR25 family glycosyltransferase involved in LPS biosynthesis
MFQTPVLLITFNRPIHTQKVFDEIKKQKPKFLFIFQDGPRDNYIEDESKCIAVRKIFENQIDWDCNLKTYYSERNLGCGPGPAKGISWFFENVEAGLIFEDDAVPHQDFFAFAEELLKKFKNDEKVKVIGSMHLDGKKYGPGSYHFSMCNRNLCAWGTWKRSWEAFNYFLDNVSETDFFNALKYYKTTLKEVIYWSEKFSEIKKDCMNHSSWDIQFIFSIWLNQGVGVFPNVNLSTNIGFGSEATHTTMENHIASNVSTGKILPLVHPKEIKISRKADLSYHKLYFQSYEYGWEGFIRSPFLINKMIKRKLGIYGSWNLFIKNKVNLLYNKIFKK